MCIRDSSYREGLPRSLLEAQAIGRPIITTNAPGCIDLIVNQSNGYSCKLKNKEDLFKKIELMINIKHKERVKMGQIGRQIVENQYDQVKVIKTYLGEIKTLIINQCIDPGIKLLLLSLMFQCY